MNNYATDTTSACNASGKLIDIKKTANLLSSWDNIFILTHISPDGDTLGSSIALCHLLISLGKKAIVLNSEKIPSKYDFLFEGLTCETFNPEHIITVDVASTQLLGNKLSIYAENIDLAIDHHASNSLYAKNTLLHTSASAVGEVIFDIFKAFNISLNDHSAAAIYTAISTDTGCFKYSNVTKKTHLITAELLEYNFDFAKINYEMFDLKSLARLKLELLATNSLELFLDNKCAVITITKDILKKSGAGDDDTDGLASVPRTIDGVLIGITMKERDTGFKISVRTCELLCASKICSVFGGGGHPRASGCFISGTADEVKEKILHIVKSELDNIL